MDANALRELAKKQNSEFPPKFQGNFKFSEFPADVPATVIIACNDPRCNPAQFWGFGDAPMVYLRNGGGRASDSLRSLRIMAAAYGMGKGKLGTICVVHHVDCGLTNFDDQGIKDIILSRNSDLLTEEQTKELQDMKLETIQDVKGSIREDMEIIRNDPYLPRDVEIIGFVYDTFKGTTTEVV